MEFIGGAAGAGDLARLTEQRGVEDVVVAGACDEFDRSQGVGADPAGVRPGAGYRAGRTIAGKTERYLNRTGVLAIAGAVEAGVADQDVVAAAALEEIVGVAGFERIR